MNISKIELHSEIQELTSSKKAPKYIKALQEAKILTVENLVWIGPSKIHSIPEIAPFTRIKKTELFRGIGEIKWVKKYYTKRIRKRFLMNVQVNIQDLLSKQSLTLNWFNTYPSTYNKLASCQRILFWGPVNSNLSLSNPQFKEWDGIHEKKKKDIEIEYPTINKVSGHHIASLIGKIPSDFFKSLSESLPQNLIVENNLISLPKALQYYHCLPSIRPSWNKAIFQKAKDRLVYEELFWEQLKLSSQKTLLSQKKSPVITWTDKEQQKFLSQLPFQLTSEQKKVLQEFKQDLEKGCPMHRLLQGDVGCGKTIIALTLASLVALKKFQIAILCPTEGLAQQFYQNLKNHNYFNLKTDLLVGGPITKEKRNTLDKLAIGETQIIVGTHALIQKTVKFKNLGLAIIDEQHKFGVGQRNTLINKGKTQHFLLMSATPIPRSLGLTLYGNLDISTVAETPFKNRTIHTKIITHDLKNKMLSFILTRISMGEQAYIVVPAISETDIENLTNLNEIFQMYQKYFPQIAMSFLHGKMKAEEKNQVLKNFKENKISILVSTTVIEVGIDVPNATSIVIYNPERFGLSSLHQLRGRVGRGTKPGFCFLDCLPSIARESKARLEKFLKCKDGFDIAEIDLEVRGPGNFIGNEQSGYSIKRKISDPVKDYRTLVKVKNDVSGLQHKNPKKYSQLIEVLSSEETLSPV